MMPRLTTVQVIEHYGHGLRVGSMLYTEPL